LQGTIFKNCDMSAHKPESNKACAARMGAHGFFEVRQLTRMESASLAPQQRLVACVQVCRVDVV
jgi:hypothetical protein